MKEHVIKFFQFLEAKEGKPISLKIKLLNQDKFKITKDELNVKGSLDLHDTIIKSLPNGLKVSGILDLNECASLTSLPNGLQVGEYLELYNCTSLKSLPDDLQVGEYLYLNSCTLLTSLPKGLKVVGNLFLKNTPLAEMYSADEIRAMIEAGGGYVKRDIVV